MKMSANCLILIIAISSVFSSTLDDLTQSNYEKINLKRLTGKFEIDFDNKIVNGNLTYEFVPIVDDIKNIFLDTKYLEIKKITKMNGTNGETEEKELQFSFGNPDEIKGTSLNISCNESIPKDQSYFINIRFSTTKYGNSATFLNPEQTIGKKEPFFYTVSKMILGRQLLPIQDTPDAAKFTFYLGIKVPKKYRGLISGLLDKVEEDGDFKTYYYKQDNKIPNYVLNLAAGKFEEKNISDNITVYCESEFIDKAAKILEDAPRLLNDTLAYLGEEEYVWKKFNLLVIPNSFPYSSMESPNLHFVSQCLFDENKSMVDIILHNLMHDWAGNLVTSKFWKDFWVMAGISTFLRRKIMGKWKGEDYAKLDSSIGIIYIKAWADYYGEDSSFASLSPNYTGVNPDEYYNDLTYEKGYNFFYYLESLIGEKKMQSFIKHIVDNYKFSSISAEESKTEFINFCTREQIQIAFSQEDWEAWVVKSGICPVDNKLENNTYVNETKEFLKVFDTNETLDIEQIKKWDSLAISYFLIILEDRKKKLTEKQHDFLTNQLKLYQGYDFFLYSNFWRMIVHTTDKFIANELEDLKKYLGTYGAYDYMSGTYENFYKRDEEECQKTFESLKSFYHPLFINQTKAEIDYQKENYPILTVDYKEKDQCKKLDDLTSKQRFEINPIEYEQFKSIKSNYEIPTGIHIEMDNETMKANCSITEQEKYCIIDKDINKSGVYILKIPQRIQESEYSIRVHESKIKVYIRSSEVEKTKTKDHFEFDYSTNNEPVIEIYFKEEPDDKVYLKKENKVINCTKKEKSIIQCKIKKEEFDLNQENPENFKVHIVSVYDICDNKLFYFNVDVKSTTPKTSGGLKGWQIALIIILPTIVIIIVVYLTYRYKKKNAIDLNAFNQENNKLMDI